MASTHPGIFVGGAYVARPRRAGRRFSHRAFWLVADNSPPTPAIAQSISRHRYPSSRHLLEGDRARRYGSAGSRRKSRGTPAVSNGWPRVWIGRLQPDDGQLHAEWREPEVWPDGRDPDGVREHRGHGPDVWRGSARKRRWKIIVGDRLELFSAGGTRLAVFAGRAQTPPQAASPRLQGTSWQLVKFQGSDDTTRTPQTNAPSTPIAFGADGRLSARIDCNRGHRAPGRPADRRRLELGPLALTRASCPPESMHDQIVKQWSFIRGLC